MTRLNRRITATIALAMLSQATASLTGAQTALSSGALQVALDKRGVLTTFRNSVLDVNFLMAEHNAALLTLVSDAKRYAPTAMRVASSPSGKTLTLQYAPTGVRIVVRVREEPTHLALEIVSAIPEGKIDAVVWGPYVTPVTQTIGEVIGVVRDGRVAVGLQILNMKTLGGDLPNSEGSTWARGIAAVAVPGGSALQAYSINRHRARRVDAWGGNQKDMPVPAIVGETVVGSSIALFTCAESETLDVLERIEVAERLPHPTIDGVWFRKSPLFEKSYMISSFGESDVDEMIGYAKRAGLFSLYHEGPFASWGHFVLSETQFPNGRQGMKVAVDKARAAGLHFGVHTLTNFINTNDPYVTPVPDDRLSVTGSSTLVSPIDAGQREIVVASPEYFREEKENHLHTVKIGKELIQYQSVTLTRPFTLLNCQRGAFGTTASAHRAGDTVGKLFDHSYKVFFPNFAMQREVARNLADFLNDTGVDHIDFDGHEGGLASGQGDYALAVFAKDVLDQTRHDLINGTSTSKTFYWHIGSYYNWGEPWYGGFKESMQQYRIDNQGLFDRNYMPHMLGWYLLTENTTLAEMEWMLSRAAGYRAGFAMVARPPALRKNPLTPALLDAIREWERARTQHAFDSAQESRLKDPKNEFHLESAGDGQWNLFQYAVSGVFIREKLERQPGEPTHTIWEVRQEWTEQPLQFRLNVQGKSGSVRNLRMQVDRYTEVVLPIELANGESLVCDGTTTVRVYDALGKPKSRYTLAAPLPVVAAGAHTMTMDSEFTGAEAPSIEVQFKGLGRREVVRARR
ncbi:MAG: hypothetical protein IPP90_03110 [Gemmatimonadaceae bacterium]|nr:hypothetical protein [Gemmatimonadaceae bacterium]